MIHTSLFVMFLMRAETLCGQVGGGGALEISSFWAPNATRLSARSMPFHRAQKTFDFQGPIIGVYKKYPLKANNLFKRGYFEEYSPWRTGTTAGTVRERPLPINTGWGGMQIFTQPSYVDRGSPSTTPARTRRTDKKENQIFLIYQEIQNGAVAKPYMTNSLLKYGEIFAHFLIY
jgi:hypothetical protein